MRNEAAIWSMSFAARVVLRSVELVEERRRRRRELSVLPSSATNCALSGELDAGLRQEGLHLGDVGGEVALGGRGLGARRPRRSVAASILSKRAATSAGSTAPVDACEAAEAVADGLLGHDADGRGR